MIQLRPGSRILDWQRRAVELRVLGLTYRDIGEQMGRTKRTVEILFQRPDIKAELERLRGRAEETFLRVATESLLAGALNRATYRKAEPASHRVAASA